MALKLLVDYVSSKEEYENRCLLDSYIDYIEHLFEYGQREFFGVHVNDDGFPLRDENEYPENQLNNHLSKCFREKSKFNRERKVDFSTYMLTLNDLNYFNSIYGVEGYQFIEDLRDVAFEEFRWAGYFFQKITKTVWKEFGLTESQMVRDQILFIRQKEPIGFVQIPLNRYSGIEHLKPKSISNTSCKKMVVLDK